MHFSKIWVVFGVLWLKNPGFGKHWISSHVRVIALIHVSCVTCHVSRVACHVSPVTCQLSLTLTARAADPPSANSHIMHSRLVRKDPKIQKKIQTQKNHCNNKNLKMSRGMPILAIHSLTSSLQSTRKQVFRDGTDRYTDSQVSRLRDWISQWADSVKIP